MQFDLFSQTPALPISPRHPQNDRCFAIESTHVERFAARRVYCEIKIARDKSGFHWAISYDEPFAHSGGPVFPCKQPLDTFDQAKAAAIARLREIAPKRCDELRKLMESL
jgi:hypothetical protein